MRKKTRMILKAWMMINRIIMMIETLSFQVHSTIRMEKVSKMSMEMVLMEKIRARIRKESKSSKRREGRRMSWNFTVGF